MGTDCLMSLTGTTKKIIRLPPKTAKRNPVQAQSQTMSISVLAPATASFAKFPKTPSSGRDWSYAVAYVRTCRILSNILVRNLSGQRNLWTWTESRCRGCSYGAAWLGNPQGRPAKNMWFE